MMKISKHRLQQIIREELSEVNLGRSFGQIEYTGLILDDESRQKLLQYVPDGWEPHAHHMTIISPPEQSYRLPSHWLNFQGCFPISGIAFGEKVIAALVDPGDLPIPFKGPQFLHVTVAVNREAGGKPMMSNDFDRSDFKPPPDGPLHICGHVEEILR